jgi:hypothetical protein
VDVSIKVIDENVNLTRINKYFSKEAWNQLKDIISTKKENAVYVFWVCQTVMRVKLTFSSMTLIETSNMFNNANNSGKR